MSTREHPAVRSGHLVRATLAAARAHAERHGVDLVDEPGTGGSSREPHELAPEPGTATTVHRVVAPSDTAASVGHPDADVDVLSTPTLALWFELVASDLMPAPGGGVQHLGVGVLVHHLGGAVVGDEVTIRAEVTAVDGRAVLFACDAEVDGELVAVGDHQRLIVATG